MKSFILFTFIALSQARFNQEEIPIDAIIQVQGGSPHEQLAGTAQGRLMASKSPGARGNRKSNIEINLEKLNVHRTQFYPYVQKVSSSINIRNRQLYHWHAHMMLMMRPASLYRRVEI